MPEHRTDCAHAEQPQVEYRDVPGFPGYRVGDDGSVWSRLSRNGKGPLKRDWQKLAPNNCCGYHIHGLRRGGRSVSRRAHRLVLEAFVGPRPDGMECCHGDGNRTNNALSNLRWDTKKANSSDAVRHGTTPKGERNIHSKITEEKAKEVISFLDGGGLYSAEVAARANVSVYTVEAIRSGRSWKHLPRGRVYARLYYGDEHHSRRVT